MTDIPATTTRKGSPAAELDARARRHRVVLLEGRILRSNRFNSHLTARLEKK